MKNTVVSFLLFLLSVATAWSQSPDSLSINGRTVLWNDQLMAIGNKSAMQYSSVAALLSPLYNYSSAAVSFDLRNESKALLPENGDGLRQGSFDARTFRRLKANSAVKGSVSYRRAVKSNVLLNETADYELLRPYVLIDTVGGNLQHEQYSFDGAWMRHGERFVYSIGGSYKAVHEYRRVDPRPRDISSDFRVDASFGLLLPGGSVSAFGAYRKYHQSQNVSFMSTVGANTALFHATGLGNDYYRFRSTGVFAGTRYAGRGFDAGLVGRTSSGRLQGGVDYGNIGVTRHLSNQNEAPLSLLRIGTLRGFVSYMLLPSFAVEADASYQKRTGVENVIDCAASGIYQSLMSMHLYTQHEVDASLRGVVVWKSGWRVIPVLGYHLSSEAYLYPSSEISFTALCGNFTVGYSGLIKKLLYDVDFAVGYRAELQGNNRLMVSEVRLRELYSEKYRSLMEDRFACQVHALLQKEVSGSTAVFSRVSLGTSFTSDGNALFACALSIGVSY